ncbi:hypothetical protein [Epilithonimonas lactis]|uniref:Uncharacterized protein n=1 Tax=Epilithonimonas lactis TaxID=421072 RepID=A0A085B5V4_9FLAO|nr:hypothetical protein [Epilithonimonas lactis]KFC17849.1 hypothetical protein IO89_20045 [Epilithonimonas lactis]SEQ77756.1 hypothetical protein SAMN04488097_2965 [Epilithonimonas lactis]
MKTNNGYTENRFSKSLSIWIKVFGVFFLCLFNFTNAQDVSDENSIQEFHNNESTADNEIEDFGKSKIYVTAGTSILGSSDDDFEIVKIKDSKKSYVTKKNPTKKLIFKKLEEEAVKQYVSQILPIEEGLFATGLENDHFFSIKKQYYSAVAQTQNPTLKHFIRTGFSYFHIVALDATQAKTPNALVHFCGEIDADSYSVRPPPALL